MQRISAPNWLLPWPFRGRAWSLCRRSQVSWQHRWSGGEPRPLVADGVGGQRLWQ